MLCLQSLLSSLEQVVDVGGGTGFCTQGVVKTVPPTNVTLLDQSPHQLEKARKKADLQGISIVEVPIQLYLSHTLCISTTYTLRMSTIVPLGTTLRRKVRTEQQACGGFHTQVGNPSAIAEPLRDCRFYNVSILASQGDAEDLPFPTDSFDRYVSAGSIEYWPEPQRGIKEAYR